MAMEYHSGLPSPLSGLQQNQASPPLITAGIQCLTHRELVRVGGKSKNKLLEAILIGYFLSILRFFFIKRETHGSQSRNKNGVQYPGVTRGKKKGRVGGIAAF